MTEDEMFRRLGKWTMQGPIAHLSTIAILIPALIWRGFVLSWFWLWFVAPFGLPPISLWWAVGIALVFGMAIPRRGQSKDETIGQLAAKQIPELIAITLVFGLGWLVQLGMPS